MGDIADIRLRPIPEPRELPSESELKLLDAQEAVRRLGVALGWSRLATLVRNMAHIEGVDVSHN